MKKILLIALVPFVLSFLERIARDFLLNLFGLGDIHTMILRTVFVICLIFVFLLFSKNNFGMLIPNKYKGLTATLVFSFPLISLFFFLALKANGLLTERWFLAWILWTLAVFREEFVIRGIIQTECYGVLKGKFLGISYPILFTCFIFGLWHLINLQTWSLFIVLAQVFASFTYAGLLHGWVREKTGSTIISYLVHIDTDIFFWTLYLVAFSKPFFVF